MKNKTKRYLIILGLIFLVFVIYEIFQNKSILSSQNYSKGNSISNKLLNSNEPNVLPNSNYSCNDIIPSFIIVNSNPGSNLDIANLTLKNGVYLHKLEACKYNKDVGEKATEFNCKISYTVDNQLSEEGIIEKSYIVIFNIVSDDDNCTQEQALQYYGAWGKCKIKSATCSWTYCKEQNCMDELSNSF